MRYLEEGDSDLKLIRRISITEFIGYIEEDYSIPNFILNYNVISPSEKFNIAIEDISMDNYFLVDSLVNPGSKVCFITVEFFENGDFSDLWSQIEIVPIQDRSESYFFAIDPCDNENLKLKISQLINIPQVEVVSITPEFTNTLFNIGTKTKAYEIHSGITPYKSPYQGENMKIGFWDLGSAVNHPDFENRIKLKQCGFISCNLFRKYGENHPTLVAGVLLGSGNVYRQLMSGQSNFFPPMLVGIAPKALGYSYDVLYADGEIQWAKDVYGIDVSSNSWHLGPVSISGRRGDPRVSYYARAFNKIAYNLDDLPIVFAAGNTICEGYPGMEEFCIFIKRAGIICDPEGYYNPTPGVAKWDCLYPPSSSKNILTVGSIDVESSVSKFSSRGPTWDGRIKPDVVSLGEKIVTTDKDNNNKYIYTFEGKHGTSFSTPTVAAHTVLLKQLLNERISKENIEIKGYESALIKAAFIHTARDIGTEGPDFSSGWGEINPKDAINVLSKNTFILDSFNEKNKMQTKIYAVKIPTWENIEKPFKVTLVYSDYWEFGKIPFGVTRDERRELFNNLDLSLCDSSGSPLIKPFVLDWKNPVAKATRGFNDRDNVEQVLAKPEEVKNIINVQTTHLYVCVRFSNYLRTPQPDQKFVLIIGDGSNDQNSYELTCGNGMLETQFGEECDTTSTGRIDYGGKTCRNFGSPVDYTNLLRCTKECKIDSIRCQSPTCGNNKKDSGEMCDLSYNKGEGCSLGCYGSEEGKEKACKCMCVNNVDCQGPGRTNVVCEDGVCQGCGDGELDVNEQCDDTSSTNTQMACKKIYGYNPAGTAKWLCSGCRCLNPNTLGGDQYWCMVGKKTIPNPPECSRDGDCKAGEKCNNDCNCEKKINCVREGNKKTVPKVQCTDADSSEGIKEKKCSDRDKECNSDCECTYMCAGSEISYKPQCNDKKKCPIDSKCNADTCKCEPVLCGNGIDTDPGEECDPPGSKCTPLTHGSISRWPGTCTKDCKCISNAPVF